MDDVGIAAFAVEGEDMLEGWAPEGTAIAVGCASGAGCGVFVEAETVVVDCCVVDAAVAGGCLCKAGVVRGDAFVGGGSASVARRATAFVGLLSGSYPSLRGCWSR